MKATNNINITTETQEKFVYAAAIIGVISAASSGDAVFNRKLLADIEVAAAAARDLLDQVCEDIQERA